MEFISYMAIDESAAIAAEKGSYKNFEGSGWSRGMVPIDTMEKLARERGVEITVPMSSVRGIPELDWEGLRKKVRRGMRNATVMAIAPNANIGLVAGTSPGIDPRFAQMFSRNKISGKYLEINPNLVHDLKDHGFWEKFHEEILTNHGDIQNIDGIPDEIKRIYKTSFATAATAFVEVAARAQKWVDQAISRNMYLDTRDIGEVMKIYTGAWEKGLKTTYYLHMKPQHTAEQSTTNVNKSQGIGKSGFAALFGKAKPAEEVVVEASAPVAPVAQTPAPAPAPVAAPVIAQVHVPPATLTPAPVATAPRPAPFAGLGHTQQPPAPRRAPTLILPEDPADAMTCEGCQ
jgi:ribonucleoside-diphosphate reductase alpha chain